MEKNKNKKKLYKRWDETAVRRIVERSEEIKQLNWNYSHSLLFVYCVFVFTVFSISFVFFYVLILSSRCAHRPIEMEKENAENFATETDPHLWTEPTASLFTTEFTSRRQTIAKRSSQRVVPYQRIRVYCVPCACARTVDDGVNEHCQSEMCTTWKEDNSTLAESANNDTSWR